MSSFVIRDAFVRTCDQAGTVAEAVAVRDGRIAEVGSIEQATLAAGAGAQTFSAQGRVVLPGLVDTHPHVMHFSVLGENKVDLSDAKNHADVEARIRAIAAKRPAGEWVQATPVGEAHYFQRRSWRDLEEGQVPDRHVLDRAAPEHPVVIEAWAPVVPNTLVFNTAALRRLGITRETPDRIGKIEIEKAPGGEPTGRLRGDVNFLYSDEPFSRGLWDQMPFLNPELLAPATIRGMAEFNAMGVTSGYEGHLMDFPMLALYQWLRSEEKLSMRMLCAPEAEPYGLPWTHPLSDDELDTRLEQALELTDRSDDMLRFDGVTIGRGGPCWPGLLRTYKPYRGPFGELTTGKAFVSDEHLTRVVQFCAERGLRLNMLTAGPADHDDFLENLEALGRTPLATDDRPWIMQHLYLVQKQQLPRVAKLGIDVTTSMSFPWGKGEVVRERIGEDALLDLVPLQRMLDAGLRVACGTDWGPSNVFEHIALAVEPVYAASKRHAATPGIARDAALAMWTRQAAKVLCWDGIGTIEPGAHADLIVVDRDPLECPLDELPDTVVEATVLGGEIIYGELERVKAQAAAAGAWPAAAGRK